MLARKTVGAFERQQDVVALLHHRPREADRRARRPHPGDRSGIARAPVHDRGVELDMAVERQHAAAAGVEGGIVFEDARRCLDRVERVAAR